MAPANPFGGGGSSGSTDTSTPTTGGKATGSAVPQRALFKLAARLNSPQVRREPSVQAEIRRQTADALKGYSLKQIQKLGTKYGLQADDIQVISAAAQVGHGGTGPSPIVGALDVLNRPAQAVQGALTEGSGITPSFSGAVKGFTGEKRYDPAASVLQSFGGQNAKQAQQTLGGLGWFGRFSAELGAGIATDPLTYASFGTNALAESAARSAAPVIAESRGLATAEDAARATETGVMTSHPGINEVYQDLTKNGVRNLSRDERGLVKDMSPGLRNPLYQRLKDNPGGARVAGMTIPGTPSVQSGLENLVQRGQNLLPERAGVAEAAFRPHGQMLAEERAGKLLPGTSKDVENLVSYAEGKGLEGGVHQAEVRNATQALAKEAGSPEALAASFKNVSNSLEENLVGHATELTPAEAHLRDVWRRNNLGVFPEQVAANHLQGVEQATAALRKQVLDRAAPKIASYQARVTELGRAADEAQAQVADLQQTIARLPPSPFRDSKIEQMNEAADRAAQARTDLGTATKRAQTAVETAKAKAEQQFAVSPENYGPRYLTEEAQAERGAAAPPTGTGGAQSGPLAGNLNARELKTRNTPTTQITTREGKPYFEPNIGMAMERRTGSQYRDLGRTEVSSQLAKMKTTDGSPLQITSEDTGAFAKAEAEFKSQGAKAGYQPVTFPVEHTDAAGVTHLTNETTYVHSAIAPDVQRLAKIYSDAGQKWLKDSTDYLYQLWKGYALTSTGFLAKKTQGELINGFWLTGTSPVGNVKDAISMSHQVAKGVAEGDAFKYLSAADKTTFLDAVKSRSLWSGFEKSDLGGGPQGYIDSLEKHGWGKVGQSMNPLSRDFLPLRATRGAANWISNNMRLGLFIGLRNKGYSAAEAGRLVRKYMFDYSELSPADRAIRYVSPFFTWTRKNVPLQLETLAKNPLKITAQLHAVDALNTVAGPNAVNAAPQWAIKGGGFVAPFSTGGQKTAIVPNTPLTSTMDSVEAIKGLANLIPGIHKVVPSLGGPGSQQEEWSNLYNAVSPGGPIAGPVGAGLQALAGKNFFSGAPIKPGQQVPTPTWLGGSHSPFGKSLPSETVLAIQALFPLSSKLEGLAPQYAPTKAGTSKAGQKINAADNRAKSVDKLWSMATGATFTPINDKSRAANIYIALEKLQALENWLTSQGGKVPTTAELGNAIPKKTGKGSPAASSFGK